MIVGLLLRHFKSYYNINFIPILKKVESPYSVFIGNNGVGKSALLESLDVFFNDREWNINMYGKKSEAFICPVFLIDKQRYKSKHPKGITIIEVISDYFWTVDERANPNIQKHDQLIEFLTYRDSLKKYQSDYYFFLIGEEYNNKEPFFSTFNAEIKKHVKGKLNVKDDEVESQLMSLRKNIMNYYSYIYIPVEQAINEILKLEAREMQTLLNKDLLEEIEKFLTDKLENGSGKKESFVDYINHHLDVFMEDVNGSLSDIDRTYSYNPDSFSKRRLTARDIREKVLEAYFPLRSLKKNKKNLNQLSSGEQRKALIDVAYAFLTTNADRERERNIVLAIDEPETSMHVSNCFDQFARLEKLANGFKNQILVTTHWYGFLPITSKGYMHYIEEEKEKEVKITTFSFYNYLEEKNRYPDVVELKSMYDLATSILTFMRNNPVVNWIICEGSDDRIYLEYLLRDLTNLKILPVGGSGNVVKLYQLLYSPISEKVEIKSIKGKILFLIDTDKQFRLIERPFYFSKDVEKTVFLRRLQISVNNEAIKLVNPFKSSDEYEETEIEDCLNPKIYYQALKALIKDIGDESLIDTLNNFDFNKEASFSRIKGDDSVILAKSIDYHKKKKEIIEFVSNYDNKYKIAQKYVEICKTAIKHPKHKLTETLRAIIFE